MIYKSLRILPMITYIDIIDTGDITLLSDENNDIDVLYPIWEKLHDDYQEKYNQQGSKKVFQLAKEISFLENKYITINYAVEALKFDVHQELIDMLIEYGYQLRIDNYIDDLSRIERESKGIISRIKMLKNILPKANENKKDNTSIIVNLMASYSAVLGYDFDFYTISVDKFHSLEYQVKQKIIAIEKQNAKKK